MAGEAVPRAGSRVVLFETHKKLAILHNPWQISTPPPSLARTRRFHSTRQDRQKEQNDDIDLDGMPTATAACIHLSSAREQTLLCGRLALDCVGGHRRGAGAARSRRDAVRRSGGAARAAGLRRVRPPAARHGGPVVGHDRHRERNLALRLPDAGRHPARRARVLRHRRSQLQLRRRTRLQPAGRLQHARPAARQRSSRERQRLRPGERRRGLSGSTPRCSSASKSSAARRRRSTAPTRCSRS